MQGVVTKSLECIDDFPLFLLMIFSIERKEGRASGSLLNFSLSLSSLVCEATTSCYILAIRAHEGRERECPPQSFLPQESYTDSSPRTGKREEVLATEGRTLERKGM